MEKFILVSINEGQVLRESIDLVQLIDLSFEYGKSASLQECVNVLTENGHRILVNSGTPFLYESALHEASLKDLWSKAKSKLGIGEDEFEQWYEDEKAKRQEAGTWKPSGASKYSGGFKPAAPKSVFDVGVKGSSPQPYSRRDRRAGELSDKPTTSRLSDDELKQYKAKTANMLKGARSILGKLIVNDKDAFDNFFSELQNMKAKLERQYASLTEAESDY